MLEVVLVLAAGVSVGVGCCLRMGLGHKVGNAVFGMCGGSWRWLCGVVGGGHGIGVEVRLELAIGVGGVAMLEAGFRVGGEMVLGLRMLVDWRWGLDLGSR